MFVEKKLYSVIPNFLSLSEQSERLLGEEIQLYGQCDGSNDQNIY